MEVRNYTPFKILVFNSLTPSGVEYGVVVIRGTFRPDPDAALLPLPGQDDIVVTDEYFGEINESSLRRANDLAPVKLKTDIHLNAVAYAPGNVPAPSWRVGVRVGDKLDKRLQVTGPRQWQHRFLRGWRLTDPEPVTTVDIRYENAFGITPAKRAEPDQNGAFDPKEVFTFNPIGQGLFDPDSADKDKPIAAPQIEAPHDPIKEPGKRYIPQGFGPIPPAWEPRLELAGTFGDPWLENKWPLWPDDHDPAHHNSAHPDLIYPEYLKGDETITLQGLTPGDDEVEFRLPGYQLATLLRRQNGSMTVGPLILDTVCLDVTSADRADWRAHLVWRSQYALMPPLRVLEARMKQP